jgi:hypothetical protein
MLCLPQYPLTLSTQFLLAALLCTSTASMNAATHQSAGNAQTESDSTANSGFSVAILPKFDVVSIKPPGPNTTWLIGVSPDGYHALNQPLGRTILRAFLSQAPQKQTLLQNAPNWVWDDKYDFVAKVSSEDIPQ